MTNPRLGDKLGGRISTTNSVAKFTRQTCCPHCRDKLGVRIAATNLLSGNTLWRPVGNQRLPSFQFTTSTHHFSHNHRLFATHLREQ